MSDIPLALSAAEAAKLLGIGTVMLYDLINKGDIKSVKLGRRRLIPRSEVFRLLGQDDLAGSGTIGPVSIPAMNSWVSDPVLVERIALLVAEAARREIARRASEKRGLA